MANGPMVQSHRSHATMDTKATPGRVFAMKNVGFSYEKSPFIVDLPISMVIFHRCVYVYHFGYLHHFAKRHFFTGGFMVNLFS